MGSDGMKLKFKLRLLMAKKDVRTIKEVAEGSGVSRQVLDRIDKDKSRRLDYDTVEKLCAYFGCEVGELMYIDKG